MIDAHVHIWGLAANGCVWPTPDLHAIHRDFGLDDLRVAAGKALEGCILVQSQEDPADTEWLIASAADPLVAGVVGWSDLSDAQAVRRLAGRAKLVGLRPMVQDRAADWYDDPAIDPALAAMAELGLVLDALVRPRHLAALNRLAMRHADLAIVIDHAAKPDFGDLREWTAAMRAIARHPNVHCKLSGLRTELAPGQSEAAIEDVFAILWEAFGADRVVWGSDWPVLTLAGNYADWADHARGLVLPEHHGAVFGGNAIRVYRLKTRKPDGGKGS